ncbi:hypothetical protein HK104_003215, partial [Borealophlyctis nickersoniae]
MSDITQVSFLEHYVPIPAKYRKILVAGFDVDTLALLDDLNLIAEEVEDAGVDKTAARVIAGSMQQYHYHLSSVVREVQNKNLRVVLVLDEIQDVARWSDGEKARGVNRQLHELQNMCSDVVVITSGSSVFTSRLLFNYLDNEAIRVGEFAGYAHWRKLDRQKAVSLVYTPIFDHAEFERVVNAILNPTYIDYDSSLWSLENVDEADGELKQTEKGSEEGESEYPTAKPQRIMIPESAINILYSSTGGTLNGLDTLIKRHIDVAHNRVRVPTPEEIHQRLISDIEEFRYKCEMNPGLEPLYDQLFDAVTAKCSGNFIQDYDLFSLPAVNVRVFENITAGQIALFADAGLIQAEFESYGIVTEVRPSSPNLLVVMMAERKMLHSSLRVEDMWVARLVLQTVGIEIESVLNKALVGKTLTDASEAAVVTIPQYDEEYFSIHSQIRRHNAHSCVKHATDTSRLAGFDGIRDRCCAGRGEEH